MAKTASSACAKRHAFSPSRTGFTSQARRATSTARWAMPYPRYWRGLSQTTSRVGYYLAGTRLAEAVVGAIPLPRAKGNDFAELFGYAPDDTSPPARRQWKSQNC